MAPLATAPARRAIRSLALGVLLATGVGAACPLPAAADAPTPLLPVRTEDLPTLLDDGDVGSLREAIRRSLAWLERQPAGRRLVFGPRAVTVSEQARGFRRLLDLLADDPPAELLEERVLREFEVQRGAGRADGAVLVTGYHEPVVEAAETPSREYSVPILGVPGALLGASLEGRRPAPTWTRADIEEGRVPIRGLAIAWARDPVDVFFMEVEGSGTLRLPDGREIRVGYAATNGRPYRSIGRLLIDEGKIDPEAMSMQALRAWLDANPAQRSRVLRHNESYVFFERRSGPPLGSLGVPLTPERSIATDARLFPPGVLAFVRTERPVAREGRVQWRPVSRFVLNQDTGGAIRGPGRVDVFWGRGLDADLASGLMKQVGELYILVPRVPERVVRVPAGER